MWALWLQFLLCSTIIVISGTFLSRYGDILAEKIGLGRAWLGLVLMAGVTSLPELITGISSVAVVNAPDIALGDVMGSCVFNLAIIALLDILHGPRPIFSSAEHGHILAAGFGVILIGLTTLSILLKQNVPSIGFIGLYTPIIVLIYGIAMRGIFLFERRKVTAYVDKVAETLRYREISLSETVFKYVLNALIIIVAATYLPFIGDRLAEETGLGKSFIGTVFIALTTSLPELVVSISALKIGATDMAIGILFGSNLFNIFILAVDDLCYLKGPLLSHVVGSHVVTGTMAILMTGITVIGLTYRLERKRLLRLGWDALSLLLAFILNIYLLYLLKDLG